MNTINKKRIVLSYLLSFMVPDAILFLLRVYSEYMPKSNININVGEGSLLQLGVAVLTVGLLIKYTIEGKEKIKIKVFKDIFWLSFFVKIVSNQKSIQNIILKSPTTNTMIFSLSKFLIVELIVIFIVNIIFIALYDFVGKLIYGFFPNEKDNKNSLISKERDTVIASYSIALIIFYVLFTYFENILGFPSSNSGATISVLIYRISVRFIFLARLLRAIMSKKNIKALTIFAVYGLFISLNIFLAPSLELLYGRDSIFLLIYANASNLLLLFILTKGHLEKKGYLNLLFKASIIIALVKVLRAIIILTIINKVFSFEALLRALAINSIFGIISKLIIVGLSIPMAHFIYKYLIGVIIDVKDGK